MLRDSPDPARLPLDPALATKQAPSAFDPHVRPAGASSYYNVLFLTLIFPLKTSFELRGSEKQRGGCLPGGYGFAFRRRSDGCPAGVL